MGLHNQTIKLQPFEGAISRGDSQMITGGLDKSQNIVYSLSQKEVSLIEKLRMIPYGQVVIYMINSQPDRVDKVSESIKL